MEITKKLTDATLELALTGTLDTLTAPQLEQELTASLDGVDHLALDFAGLKYVSSAGLRVLLMAQKVMNTRGGMVIRHVNPDIMDVFDITGFVDVLTIE